jgi:hypothetical protein
MNTPRRSYRMPETELARLREIQERFPDQTKALLFCINHTWATTTADGAADLVWETVANITVIIDGVDDDRHCSILDNSTERPPQ